MDEIEEHLSYAAQCEAAITAAEPYLTVGDDGYLYLDTASIDEGTAGAFLGDLVASVDDVNLAIGQGTLALSDIQTTTEGISYA